MSNPEAVSTVTIRRKPVIRYVYFIQGEMTGLIKIGLSDHPAGRRYHLQVGSPDKLVLLATIATERALFLERELHERFSACRAHGEWFRPDKDLKEYIANVAIKPAKRREWLWRRDRAWRFKRMSSRAWSLRRDGLTIEEIARKLDAPDLPSLPVMRASRKFAVAEGVEARRSRSNGMED